jgi:transcriptional regulator with XRE-family HTH domain
MNRKDRKASSDFLRRLASNLRRLRDARGYTQAELGDRRGLARSYIYNVELETLNISLAKLEALASGRDCSECDLLAPIRPKAPVQR